MNQPARLVWSVFVSLGLILGPNPLPALAAPIAAPPASEPVRHLTLDRMVATLAYSPDGKMLAVGEYCARRSFGPITNTMLPLPSVAGRVLILDAKSGTLQRTLYATYSGQARPSGPADQMDVDSLAFTPDSRTLAVGACQWGTGEITLAEITLWDPVTGQRKRSLWSGTYEINWPHTLCFSPDGRQLAAGVKKVLHPAKEYESATQGQILIWGVPSYRLKRRILTADFGSEAVDYALDNHTLLCNDNSLTLWDTRTGRRIRRLTSLEEGDAGYGVFSPDGHLIGGGSPWVQTAARLWDVHTGSLLHSMPGFKEGGDCVAFSPDGAFLIGDTGWWLNPPYKHDIRVWNVRTGALVRTLDGGKGRWFAVSPDGSELASIEDGNDVEFWHLD